MTSKTGLVKPLRVTTLNELEGLSIRDASRMPSAPDLARWGDAGLYRIDVHFDVFRLTEAGRAALNQEEQQ
jgi:hypothetical protein